VKQAVSPAFGSTDQISNPRQKSRLVRSGSSGGAAAAGLWSSPGMRHWKRLYRQL